MSGDGGARPGAAPRPTPHEWERVQLLVSAALDRDAAARPAFLEAACADEPALRREVESLLDAHERPGPLDRLAADVAGIAAELRAAGPTTLTGRALERYRVVGAVAGGGMGVVYKALDDRLGRAVALKFLHPRLLTDDSAAARFRAEARVVAALEHPNICTVHEIGETDDGQLYLAMPLYDGETLQQRVARGPLPAAEAVDVAVQVARGLAKAHARGVVHRDVKPSNVLVTGDGVVKILDFGIAKLMDAGPDTLTGPLGTVAYMSPEQLASQRLDHRTDLWSLGVLLYELLTGRRPFDGPDTPTVMLAIQRDEPVPPSARCPGVPSALDRVVLRALARSRDTRYQSAQELEHDLTALRVATDAPAPGGTGSIRARRLPRRALAGAAVVAIVVAGALAVPWSRARSAASLSPIATVAAAEPRRSIVVLPFADVRAEGEDESFGDGVTDEIITRLGSVPELSVISRTSAMHYRGSSASLREIAAELGVANVLEGSVRRSEGRLRVTARLVDAATDATRWTSSFDVEPGNPFAVQERIAREVVRALDARLLEGDRSQMERVGTRDVGAYQLYRRARFQWATRTRDGHARAIAYFQQAIARDSGYADAYAGLANAYLTAWQFGVGLNATETYSRIKWAAERAMALDDGSADAHTAFAVELAWQHNWPGAERELRRAVELNPGYAQARAWHGLFLMGMGRQQAALAEFRRAVDVDPFAVVVGENYAAQLRNTGDLDGSAEEWQRVLEIRPDYPDALIGLARTYTLKGMHAEAIRVARRAAAAEPAHADDRAILAYVLARAGASAEARRVLRSAERDVSEPLTVGIAWAALGERDSAFVWLGRAHWEWPHRANRFDPALDVVRADPRFARLSERVDREMGMR